MPRHGKSEDSIVEVELRLVRSIGMWLGVKLSSLNELRSVARILEDTDSVHAKMLRKSEDSSVEVVLRLVDSVDVRLV
jgi:hypothetical protein